MQLFGNKKTAKHSAKHVHVPSNETDNSNIITDEIFVPERDENVGQKPAAVKKSKKKKILISINPEHVNNIVNGIKKYEYRKIAAKQDISSIIK